MKKKEVIESILCDLAWQYARGFYRINEHYTKKQIQAAINLRRKMQKDKCLKNIAGSILDNILLRYKK